MSSAQIRSLTPGPMPRPRAGSRAAGARCWPPDPEWAATLRARFGEYRAPTGVSGAAGAAPTGPGETLTIVRELVARTDLPDLFALP